MWKKLTRYARLSLILTVISLMSFDTALACRWLRCRRVVYYHPVVCQPVVVCPTDAPAEPRQEVQKPSAEEPPQIPAPPASD
ncbi:MAG: hypothetical protein J5I93_13995, partial [Pirellulaceae bacterium]|nr:hypothetical protein [Pirellulaceae bacterium]